MSDLNAVWRAFPGIVLLLALVRVGFWQFDNDPALRELPQEHRVEPQYVKPGQWVKAIRYVIRESDCPISVTALVLDENRMVVHTLDYSVSWSARPSNGAVQITPFTRMYQVPPYPPGKYWLRTTVVCAKNPLHPAIPQILRDLPFEVLP